MADNPSDIPAFPMPPPPFQGDSRKLDAGACFEWLRQGWAFFADHPGIWIATAMVFLILMVVLSVVPLLGQLAVNVLLPVFAAGLLKLCREQAEGETPHLSDLFAGFRHHAGSLVTVGVLYTVGIFGIAFLAFLLISGGVLSGAITGRVGGVAIVLGSVMLTALLVFLLSVPIVMATWFAPALVYFHGMAPVAAMKASFAAGMKNWGPMMLFCLLLTIAAFFAMLPLGLGMLVLLPVISGAVYASYRDMFIEGGA